MVSVIVPVYNTCLYLSNCIDSILSQSYPNFELLLIDDGSTDGSKEICDEYSERDTRVKCFHNTNRGANFSRAFGVQKSIGEWITFVDSDDLLLSFALEKLVDNSEGVDIVCGAWFTLGAHEYTPLQWQAKCLIGGPICSPVAKLYRRELLSSSVFQIPEDIVVCEDDLMNIRVSFKLRLPVRTLDKQIYCYNTHNLSSTSHINQWNVAKWSRLYDVILQSITIKQKEKFKRELLIRRLFCFEELYIRYLSVNTLSTMSHPYVEKLKEDVAEANYKVRPITAFALRCPTSVLTLLLYKVKFKLTIAKEFCQRVLCKRK